MKNIYNSGWEIFYRPAPHTRMYKVGAEGHAYIVHILMSVFPPGLVFKNGGACVKNLGTSV